MAKGALRPKDYKVKPLPPQSRRKRGGPAFSDNSDDGQTSSSAILSEDAEQLTAEEALAKLDVADTDIPAQEDDNSYCPECYLPLHPDPKPEKLYVFLHALRYTTSLGSFETEMPGWAAEGWTWDTS